MGQAGPAFGPGPNSPQPTAHPAPAVPPRVTTVGRRDFADVRPFSLITPTPNGRLPRPLFGEITRAASVLCIFSFSFILFSRFSRFPFYFPRQKRPHVRPESDGRVENKNGPALRVCLRQRDSVEALALFFFSPFRLFADRWDDSRRRLLAAAVFFLRAACTTGAFGASVCGFCRTIVVYMPQVSYAVAENRQSLCLCGIGVFFAPPPLFPSLKTQTSTSMKKDKGKREKRRSRRAMTDGFHSLRDRKRSKKATKDLQKKRNVFAERMT